MPVPPLSSHGRRLSSGAATQPGATLRDSPQPSRLSDQAFWAECFREPGLVSLALAVLSLSSMPFAR